jgi:hypothetical protein
MNAFVTSAREASSSGAADVTIAARRSKSGRAASRPATAGMAAPEVRVGVTGEDVDRCILSYGTGKSNRNREEP